MMFEGFSAARPAKGLYNSPNTDIFFLWQIQSVNAADVEKCN